MRVTVDLRSCLTDPILEVMNFLNNIVASYPEAISFGPGRPLERLFEVEQHVGAAIDGVAEDAQRRGVTAADVWGELGQYSQTNGVIREVIAKHLAIDERIHVEADTILVTVGAQEAMAILLMGLFDTERDVLLVSDPSYIGITGLARILGIRTIPVATGEGGLHPDAVDAAISRASRHGRVRALYDIPDFNNPLGTSLAVPDRQRLLDICARHGVLILEDNPYGMFAYDHERRPTLKALDETGQVVYIGSFAKMLFPGLRVGFLVADQRVDAGEGPLAVALSRVKSLTTVNTPPLTQQIVADALRRHHGSVEPIVAPKRRQCRIQRDAMLDALHECFGSRGGAVCWNRPAGGFFVTVTLPFEFGPAELHECARAYNVIVTPMRFFSLATHGRNQVRLSFSYAAPETIRTGIANLACFVDRRSSQS